MTSKTPTRTKVPRMRNVIFGVANSLDNFIARSDGAVDWLMWSSDVTALMTEFWKTIDTVLYGRKTYEVALQSGWKGGPAMKTYVFSRTLKPNAEESVEIVTSDAGAFVRALKKKKGKDICCMGGGELAQALLDADVIDEIGLNIHPVLLGAGIPLFLGLKRQIDLELLESKAIQRGCVLVRYRVKHRRRRS
jgi:dihydrofolate reductase